MASDRDTLPTNVKPVNYKLSLFDLQYGPTWTYQGRVEIELCVREATRSIMLDANELKIHSAELFSESGKTASSSTAIGISYDHDSKRCTIDFDHEIAQSPRVVLSICFEGIINDHMAGFYRSRYQPAADSIEGTIKDADNHYMFSTQFESCDARQAFPCFDEPNLKATFDVEIEIPASLVALSNMNEKSISESKRSGHKIVSFERTPIMSTYLLAWAVGDFEYIEDFTRRKYNGKNLPVRVYTTRGLKEQGRLALESAHQIVDYFSEIFQIDYPLPKVDLLAVHEFTAGAMENWGLITYRTTAVLFDERASDQRYRNRVVYVVAHELAHQWFGNLVTMDWWNELWLNEGFATWVGWYAVDHLHPDWNVWGQFVTEGMQTALQLDSLRTSHPIEVPVRNALEADQIFDSISYLKGSSVIRMLANQLGVKTFLGGVANYLKAHKYANATTSDLWSALSQAYGKDVATFMDPWIREIGFPVVTVTEEPGQIIVKQTRFLATGDLRSDEDKTTWTIPIALRTRSTEEVTDQTLVRKEDSYRDFDTSFYKLNSGQTGFYRTNLPPQRLLALSRELHEFSIEDRIGLVGDAAALAISGLGSTPAVLTLIEGFSSETNYLVWNEVVSSMARIRSVFAADQEVTRGLNALSVRLVSSAVDKLGWTFNPEEDYLTGQARSLLIATAGLAGYEKVTNGATERFRSYVAGDKNAIHPSLRSAIFRIAVKNGGKEAYEAVRQEYLTTKSVDGKEIALGALGQVQNEDLAREYLEFGFGGKVALQDVHSVGGSLAANPRTRVIVWQYIQEHWPEIRERLGGTMIVLERFLRVCLQKFADSKVLEEIEEFFRDKDNKGYDRGLRVILDTIGTNAQYYERDLEVVREWLTANRYLS